MAVNHVEGTMFASVLFYPFAAAYGANSAGVGAWAILSAPAGLAIGLAVTWIGRKFIYATMAPVIKMEDHESRLIKFLFLALLVAYLVLPYALVGAGLWVTWQASYWTAIRLQ